MVPLRSGSFSKEESVRVRRRDVVCLALVTGILLLAPLPAHAQTPAWVDPALLEAAKKEGTLVVYSSTNEQEGLPLFRLYEQATGIKVQYVRGSDSVLTSRMSIEFRAGQHAYDIVHMTTINKLPQQMLLQYEPPEAKNIVAAARDKDRRWYGVFANYNTPSYNTKMVKPEQLPKTYEEFAQRKEWVGKVAIDGTDNEWLRALYVHYGKEKAERLTRDMVNNLKPVITDGHLALARANGAGEYWLTLNNYTNLTLNVKLAGGSIDFFALDPVALFFGQVGINSKSPHPNAAKLAANFLLSQEAQAFYTKFGRLPTRSDVKPNPPDAVQILESKKVVPVLFTPEEERQWQKVFLATFKPR
jgi:iron(III) transport system substrate-binding protein